MNIQHSCEWYVFYVSTDMRLLMWHPCHAHKSNEKPLLSPFMSLVLNIALISIFIYYCHIHFLLALQCNFKTNVFPRFLLGILHIKLNGLNYCKQKFCIRVVDGGTARSWSKSFNLTFFFWALASKCLYITQLNYDFFCYYYLKIWS